MCHRAGRRGRHLECGTGPAGLGEHEKPPVTLADLMNERKGGSAKGRPKAGAHGRIRDSPVLHWQGPSLAAAMFDGRTEDEDRPQGHSGAKQVLG